MGKANSREMALARAAIRGNFAVPAGWAPFNVKELAEVLASYRAELLGDQDEIAPDDGKGT